MKRTYKLIASRGTEMPVELIRQIVDARVAELAGGAPLQTPVPADVDALVILERRNAEARRTRRKTLS